VRISRKYYVKYISIKYQHRNIDDLIYYTLTTITIGQTLSCQTISNIDDSIRLQNIGIYFDIFNNSWKNYRKYDQGIRTHVQTFLM